MTNTPSSVFSIRLNANERQRLIRQAGNKPLGRFLKESALSKRRSGTDLSQHDKAQLLAKLGQSELSRSMQQIAKAASIGALPVTPELENDLKAACADIRALRRHLMKALGFCE